MSLQPWNPLREMDSLLNQFSPLNQLKISNKDTNELMTTSDWSPVVDITESEEEYLIKAEIPGVDKKDMDVSINNRVLTLSGEKSIEKEDKSNKHHRVERFYGSFARSFNLPDNVENEKIKAEYKDGLLSLHLLKSGDKKQVDKHIAIH